jgi:hypothetical protein
VDTLDRLNKKQISTKNTVLPFLQKEEVIAGFNLVQVMNSHLAWKEKFETALMEKSAEKLDLPIVLLASECELGKWLNDEGRRLCGSMPEYAALCEAHSLFHLRAGEVLIEYQDGHFKIAAELLKTKFQTASNNNQLKLVNLVSAVKNAGLFSSDSSVMYEPNLKDVLNAHIAWTDRLQAVIDGTSTEALDVAEISQSSECEFGKWMDNEGHRLYGHLPEFDALYKEHSKFHLIAGEVLIEQIDGNSANAVYLLKSKFQPVSNKTEQGMIRLFSAIKKQ